MVVVEYNAYRSHHRLHHLIQSKCRNSRHRQGTYASPRGTPAIAIGNQPLYIPGRLKFEEELVVRFLWICGRCLRGTHSLVVPQGG